MSERVHLPVAPRCLVFGVGVGKATVLARSVKERGSVVRSVRAIPPIAERR
ncbi:MAG TPA: hypothetical protein VG057_20445 [Solirubrobacteraceae bacterium]|nr:hypothetical protein [Solirubrobacteraceae bacterium]